jgi:hypothetical protein
LVLLQIGKAKDLSAALRITLSLSNDLNVLCFDTRCIFRFLHKVLIGYGRIQFRPAVAMSLSDLAASSGKVMIRGATGGAESLEIKT